MKIENPLSINAVPELSGKSQITSLEVKLSYGGVVIENQDELRRALRFAGKRYFPVEEPSEIPIELQESLGLSLLIDFQSAVDEDLYREEITPKFEGKFLEGMIGEVEKKGSFTHHFDNRSMTVKKISTFYSISIHDSNRTFWGDDETNTMDLSTRLGKRRALSCATITTGLSVIDDWWYGMDFSFLHEKLDVDENSLRRMLDYFSGEGEDKIRDEPEQLFFQRDGQTYSIHLMLFEPLTSLSHPDNYTAVRGDFGLVGRAWTMSGWTEDFRFVHGTLEEPKVFPQVPVKISYIIAPKDGNHNEDLAMSDKQQRRFLEAIRYFGECLSEI